MKRRSRFAGRCIAASLALHGVAFAALASTFRDAEASIARRGPVDFELSVSVAMLGQTGVPHELEPDVVTPTESRSAEVSEPAFDSPDLPLERVGANDVEVKPQGSSAERPTEFEPPVAADETEAAQPPAIPTGSTSATGATREAALWLEGPDPVYPKLSVRQGEEGVVVCRLAIAADGRVRDVAVLTSSGHSRLDRAAVEALAQWRFEAAREDSERIPTEVVHRVVFRLSDRRQR